MYLARPILFLAALSLSFLSIAACGRSAAPANLTFDGQECVHEGPESISAGEVRLTLVNESDVPTFLRTVLKLHDGKTLEDVVSYLATPARDVPGWDTVLSFRAEQGRIGGNRGLTTVPWQLRDGVSVRSGSVQRLARRGGHRRRIDNPQARHRDGLQDDGQRGAPLIG